MEFTNSGYVSLLHNLKKHGYEFCNYHNYEKVKRPVILRHDIDNDIARALRLSEIERENGVASTYFVLLTSNFYNCFAKRSIEMLRNIVCGGHEIGLHFDETAYGEGIDVVKTIEREAGLLSEAIGQEITAVSMHRPSKKTLGANYVIKGGEIVNSYSELFFHDFKYLSDSRRHWREDVLGIIEREEYDKLHILTHAFWYNDVDIGIRNAEVHYINEAALERYDFIDENFRDLSEVVGRDEIDNAIRKESNWRSEE